MIPNNVYIHIKRNLLGQIEEASEVFVPISTMGCMIVFYSTQKFHTDKIFIISSCIFFVLLWLFIIVKKTNGLEEQFNKNKMVIYPRSIREVLKIPKEEQEKYVKTGHDWETKEEEKKLIEKSIQSDIDRIYELLYFCFFSYFMIAASFWGWLHIKAPLVEYLLKSKILIKQ